MADFDIRKIFGENVKRYRKKLGLSQEQLAERLGISANHLSVIETGTKFVTYKLLEKIIAELRVMPAALFFTPGSESFDESGLNKISTIIQTELDNALAKIQTGIADTVLNIRT